MKQGIELALEASKKSTQDIKSGSTVVLGSNHLTGFNGENIYSYDMILNKAKWDDIDLSRTTLYTTHEPHRRHALKLAESGIKKVVYIHEFGNRGRDVLRALGVEVVKYSL